MIEKDTVRLLRECDSGLKMGISALNDVMDHVHSQELKGSLTKCKTDHEVLENEIRTQLDRYHDRGRDPHPIAKRMSKFMTNRKLSADDSDQAIAELITNGCNMGVKSLNRYLDQYKAADEVSKDITKRLIKQEAQLAQELQGFL